jgi:caa(3)-type oxidase subunit IV
VKPAVGVAIAAVKAGIVGWVFMNLRGERRRTLIFALGGFVWLTLLLFLAWGELATRRLFT